MDLIKGTGTMSESTMVSHGFCNHLYGLVFDIVTLVLHGLVQIQDIYIYAC